MKLPATFLKTRIARRVFGLFLMCAVLPAAALAGMGYWIVSRELQDQARTQLAQASKVSGQLVLARLHEADRSLVGLIEILREDASVVAADTALVAKPFASVNLEELPSTVKPAELEHLARDRALLVVESGPRGPLIYLVRALDPGKGRLDLVWGKLSSRHLWDEETRGSLVAEGVDFCAYATGIPQPLHCSSRGADARVRSGPEADAISGSSEVFLKFDFGADSWTVRLSRPLATFTAPAEFRRVVLLIVALGIWLVVLASNVLLRYRLDPVARLQDATRRMADGDFSVAVAVSTNDELEDLATSFNTMAGRLREQFTLLGALHDVDREALVGRGDGRIAQAALRRLPDLIRVEDAVVVVRGGDGSDAIAYRMVGGDVEQQRIESAGGAFAELAGHSDHWLVERDAGRPALLGALSAMRGKRRLMLPLTDHGECFGALVLSGAFSSSAGFSEAEVRRARRIADQVALAMANTRLVERLNSMSWGTLDTLARSIDAVSPWTAGHSERVTRLGLAVGRQLGLSAEQLDQLHRGGLLHDVGKIGVPTSILDKPGKLDDAEFAAVRAHPVIGARILEPIHAYADVIPIVRHHHERFDGTGYPDKLAGEGIPYLARVLSVADVYDALVSHRPYRDGWKHEAAVAYIDQRASIEFDPDVVAAFLALVAGPAWPVEMEQEDGFAGLALAATP